ncbi:hypothetical protein BH24ACT23_BH24ACT23_00740 [soil metagenome]
MRTNPSRIFLALVALAALAVPVAGCGAEDASEAAEAVEGEPLHVGDLIYNVVLTRFLNPNLVEDGAYLRGLPEEPTGQSYLGVFIRIENDNDDVDFPSAGNYAVMDQSGREYDPVDADGIYQLEVGAQVLEGGELPVPDSPAAESPTQGALLLFLVDDDVSEERPLELEINSFLGQGTIELDI